MLELGVRQPAQPDSEKGTDQHAPLSQHWERGRR
jgi:hypothetical protein